MQFDFSGAELFLAYWEGRTSAQAVLDHPAYQAVRHHARLYSEGLSGQDVENARQGQPSPFYGLEDLPAQMPRVTAFLDLLRANQAAWTSTARTALSDLFPAEDLAITVYPIIGYDMGIGLDGVACLNCNYPPYLDEPCEFLFYAVHECVHVIYERHHRVPPLSEVVSPAEWRSYFNLFLHNEGFAVYAPLRLRSASGHLAERDYRVLSDPAQLEQHRVALLAALDRLQSGPALTQEDYLECCFGPQRLTYRMGCELIRRIEKKGGLAAVRDAFYRDADDFMDAYRSLLETP